MALGITEPPEAEAVLNELLQFEIEKTHETLFETGKSMGTAFVTYLSLVALTALLVYGRVEDSVELPLLSVKVNKDLAAAVTVLLCQIVQIWVISLMNLSLSLIDLLNYQLRQRFDRGSLESWHLQYPSPFHSVQFLINAIPGKFGDFMGWLLSATYSFIVAFFPIGLSYVIAGRANFPASLKYPWFITNTILNFSVMFGMTVAVVQLYRAETRVRTRTRLYSELDKTVKEVAAQAQEVQEQWQEVQEQFRLWNQMVETATKNTQTGKES